MIAIVIAVIFSVIGFIKLNIYLALICFIAFVGAAALSNYILRPKMSEISFADSDYELEECFNLYPLQGNEMIHKGLSRSGKEIVIFRSSGKDKKIVIRRLPAEMIKITEGDDNLIMLYAAKKYIKGNILYSVCTARATDLKAVITYHN